ncbi:unnamed protein product [Musa acuminata subsp. burmannicoides]
MKSYFGNTVTDLRESKNRGSHVDGVGRGGGVRARDDNGGGHAGAILGVHRLGRRAAARSSEVEDLPGGGGRRGGGEGVVGDEVSGGGSGFRVE